MVQSTASPFNTRLKTITSISKKAVRIEQQYHYLQNSVLQSTLPKGISSQCLFKASIQDTGLQYFFDKIMLFGASRIVDTLITYYRTWQNNLWSQHYQILENHKSTMPTKDYEDLQRVVNNIIRKEVIKCKKTHESKLKRDEETGKTYCPTPTSEATPKNPVTIKISRKRKKKPKTAKRKRNRQSSHKHKRSLVKSKLPNKDQIPLETLKKSVINLSDRELTKDHLYVFHLGDSFAPTPKLPDLMKFNDDLKKWTNTLRNAVNFDFRTKHFQNSATSTDESPTLVEVKKMERSIIKFPANNNLDAKECKHPALELFINKVTEEIKSHTSTRKSSNPSNLDKSTQDALHEMKNWQDIVIRLFDKGSGFFILNRDDYIRRTMIELDNPTTYEVMDNHEAAIKQCADALLNWTIKFTNEPGMTEKTKKWVLPSGNESPGNNYIQLKAHKPEKDFPGRLISTGCNTLTKNLAVLTAFELKKVVLKYNVKDTDDFLQRIDQLNKSGKIDNKSIVLCSFDIVSMFPSISKDLGLRLCRNHLNKRENVIFSTDCILEAIEITLDNNLSTFNDTIFRQTCGAAMGGSNSCDYADIALADLDEMIHESDLFADHGVTPPIMFSRFRDDIFLVHDADHGLSEIEKLFELCNNYHPDIKFTRTEPSTEGQEFLNSYVFIKDGKLHTRPYSKPCDSHCYLLPNSCHPLHTIKNIPYGIAHNTFKLSSSNESYELAKAEYSAYLLNRGYSHEIIQESFDKVEKLDRDDIIYKVKKDSDSKSLRNFPLVCDFNPALPPVGKIIHKYKYLLELDEGLKEIINPGKVFVSYRGNKTIKDILVPSKLKARNIGTEEVKNPELGCFKCETRCKLCKDFLDCPGKIKSFHTEQEFNFKFRLNCKSPNVIYKLDDVVCKKTSVGSSVTGMSTRWPNHKSHIRKSVQSCEVACHFSNISYHNLDKQASISKFDQQLKSQLRVTLIDQVDMSPEDTVEMKLKKVKEREAYWQNQLRTFACQGGFNKRDARKETSSRSYLSGNKQNS